jgi:putative inorganic carbon (hco3(-)) transporter
MADHPHYISKRSSPGIGSTARPVPGHPWRHAATTAKRIRRELMVRQQVAFICFGLLLAILAACSNIDALRIIDLMLLIGVMAVANVLAVRDSRHLPVLVLATWIFAPFARRVVDWQLGGFESVTALSLLPMLATTTLAIPTVPRMRRLPMATRQACLLVALPVSWAAIRGLAEYGPSAALDGGVWLMPMLLLPYFATRTCQPGEQEALLRCIVVLAAASAAYAWYQFVVLPSWDRLWLVQSGMISSMGSANPLRVRVWGTMNACGPAATIWAGASVYAMCDRRWRSPLRGLCIVAVTTALLLTRVRICWIMAAAGLLFWSLLSGKRNPGTVLGILAALAALVVISPVLPGGDLVSDRFSSFQDLEHDQSFRVRRNFASQLFQQITSNPFGAGLGYKSAGKITGSSTKLMAFDNGIGEVFYALGLPGGAAWLLGMILIGDQLRRSAARRSGPTLANTHLATAIFAMHGLGLASAFNYAGVSGIMPWMAAGIALCPSGTTSLRPQRSARRPARGLT